MKRLLEALAWGLVSLALVSCVGERVAGGSSTTDTGSEISLTGRVIDKDNVPVAGVAVRLSSAGFADTTDALGRYHVLGKAPVAALAGAGALDTLRFAQDKREVAAVPVTQWTADLPDVRIVQRDISGLLLLSPVRIGRVEAIVSGDGIPSGQPAVLEFFYNAPARHYSGFAYFQGSAEVRNYVVRINVYDSTGFLSGVSQSIAFNSLAGNVMIPAFDPGNAYPVPHAGNDTTLAMGAALHLRGKADLPVGGSIAKWEWDIGGTGAFAVVPAGDTLISLPAVPTASFLCVLRVTDDVGRVSRDTMGVSVVAKLPSVSVAGPSSSVKVGVSVVLKAQVAESFGSVSQYAWDNGKGGGWSDSSPTLSQATFSYAKRGVYSARLRVLGRGGMVDSASSQLTVWNDDPVLAGLHDTSVTTGSLLTLKATAGDPEGIRWYIWDVGADGQGLDTTTSSSRSFSMPVSPGTVRIAVAAQDGFDGITWDTLTVTVVSSVSAWAVRNQGTYLQSLGNVDFFTPARGYAIGKDPATSENIVLYTQDSGVTWSSRPITAAVGYLGAASFPDSSTGYVANGGNRLLKTTDGGATWSARNPNLPGVDAIAFVDAQRGWIVSSDNARVIRTVDGGASWTASGAVTAQRIRSIHFAGASTGWMCGTTGVLFKSVDGGGSWSSRNSGTVVNLNMIRFRDAQNGIAVGDGGVIRGSSDGGETWTTRSLGASGTSQDLTAVTWTGSHWIVVGNGGVVYSSLDGSTWTSHSSGTTKSLGSVTWTGSRIVAVGDAAVILSSP